MVYDSLKQRIKKDIKVSEPDLEAICQYFKPRSVDKFDYLLTQGNTCQFEGFVLEGCFRIFNIDAAPCTLPLRTGG
ncbi:MAG: hypothetical protein AB8H12_23335 [Lewinella sp.]